MAQPAPKHLILNGEAFPVEPLAANISLSEWIRNFTRVKASYKLVLINTIYIIGKPWGRLKSQQQQSGFLVVTNYLYTQHFNFSLMLRSQPKSLARKEGVELARSSSQPLTRLQVRWRVAHSMLHGLGAPLDLPMYTGKMIPSRWQIGFGIAGLLRDCQQLDVGIRVQRRSSQTGGPVDEAWAQQLAHGKPRPTGP